MENDFTLRDLIDPDEGYRDIDWDSYLTPEPFFTEALPCESCGRPVDAERKPAPWDPSLLIGPCCQFSVDFEFPDLPNCDELWKALTHCTSVSQVQATFELHTLDCAGCQGYGLRRAA